MHGLSGGARAKLMLPVYRGTAIAVVTCRIEPVRCIRWATACGTREQIAPPLIAFDIDLVAAKDLFADDTNALIIERLPFSQPIGCAQNIQSLFGSEVPLHITCLIEYAEPSAL
jgi:hypothetical protein